MQSRHLRRRDCWIQTPVSTEQELFLPNWIIRIIPMGETKLSDSNTTLKSAARDRLKYRHHIALFHHAALQDVYLRFKYAASGQLEENFWMQHVHTYKEQNYSHVSLHMFQCFSVCSHKIQLLPELPSQFKLWHTLNWENKTACLFHGSPQTPGHVTPLAKSTAAQMCN